MFFFNLFHFLYMLDFDASPFDTRFDAIPQSVRSHKFGVIGAYLPSLFLDICVDHFRNEALEVVE